MPVVYCFPYSYDELAAGQPLPSLPVQGHRMRASALILSLALLCPIVAGRAAAAPPDAGLTRLLRYPDASADKIAFVYGGDIWVVESTGGTARRLTSGPGEELFPKFSPDGRW